MENTNQQLALVPENINQAAGANTAPSAQQPPEYTMKKEQTVNKGARPTWDRRFKANRSPLYRNAIKALRGKGKHHTKVKSSRKRKELNPQLPKSLGRAISETLPALPSGAISVFIIAP
jgi:hypothetical protein